MSTKNPETPEEPQAEAPLPSGFAIVARFADDRPVSQANLAPGQGVFFLNTGEVTHFDQKDLAEALQRIAPGSFELLTIVDSLTGHLLISRGPNDNIGMNENTQPVIPFKIGQVRYGAIWQPTQPKAFALLKQLQQERIRLQ